MTPKTIIIIGVLIFLMGMFFLLLGIQTVIQAKHQSDIIVKPLPEVNGVYGSGECPESTLEIIEGSGRVGFVFEKEARQMEIDRLQDIQNLPEIGQSYPDNPDMIYLGYYKHPDCANNQASYNWKNKKTGELTFAISPDCPMQRLVIPPLTEEEIKAGHNIGVGYSTKEEIEKRKFDDWISV